MWSGACGSVAGVHMDNLLVLSEESLILAANTIRFCLGARQTQHRAVSARVGLGRGLESILVRDCGKGV